MTAPGQIGRYTLLRRIASGGMGEVYLAEAQGAAGFTRRVAIKRILPHLAEDPTFVRKFIDEAHLMVQLHHGNIVPVQELLDHGGELCLVMEYLPGRDLKAVIHRLRASGRRMPVDLALWLLTEVLAGLDYAHRKLGPDGQPLHLVHRDVSPANVVLGAGGEVKLIDFGIARARGGLHRSVSGTLQGKFIYMSPEQADGRPVDPRSDVFTCGLLLYELLTGLRPFEADTETGVLRKVREARILPPSQLVEIPEAIDALVMPALAVRPEDRYPTAAAMRRALAHHLADERSGADAASFAGLLAELFPEGVVPDGAPPGPLSIDDALQAQLGALTPSARFEEPTRTRTRTRSTPDRSPPDRGPPDRRPQDRSEPGAAPLPLPIGIAPTWTAPPVERRRTNPAPRPAGRRRLLLLGLIVGVALTAAVFALRPAPQPAWIEPSLSPPVSARILIGQDGAQLAPGTRLLAGRTERICADAPGHTRQCQLVTLTAGANPLHFELVATPRLTVQVEPPGAAATLTVNDLPVEQFPYEGLPAGRLATVQIHPETGWTVDGDDRQIIRLQAGENPVRFHLIPEAAPDLEPPEPPRDGGPPDRSLAQPPRPSRGRVQIEASPRAKITCDGRSLGLTPQTVLVESRPVRCELRADGHVDQTILIQPRDGTGTRRISLIPLARITARAIPAAATIYLDGQPLGPNLVRRHPVAPGSHRLEARLQRGDRILRSAPLSIELEPGQIIDDAYLLEIPLTDEEPHER